MASRKKTVNLDEDIAAKIDEIISGLHTKLSRDAAINSVLSQMFEAYDVNNSVINLGRRKKSPSETKVLKREEKPSAEVDDAKRAYEEAPNN